MTRYSLILAIAVAAVVVFGVTAIAKKAKAQTPLPTTPTASGNPLDNTVYMDLKDSCRVIIQLAPDKAPVTVARIKELVGKGFYDGIVFHRVIEGFMAQTGDPTGSGMGGSGKQLPDEYPTTSKPYTEGTLAMANAGPGTSDSQFFIMFNDYPLPPKYTVFGKVTKGMDCINKIKLGDPRNNGKVSDPDKIIKMQMATAAK